MADKALEYYVYFDDPDKPLGVYKANKPKYDGILGHILMIEKAAYDELKKELFEWQDAAHRNYNKRQELEAKLEKKQEEVMELREEIGNLLVKYRPMEAKLQKAVEIQEGDEPPRKVRMDEV